MKSLSEISVDAIVLSMSEETKENMLWKLINDKSKQGQIDMFESLGYKLYGGVQMKDAYAYVVFGLCSGASNIKNPEILSKIYKTIDDDDCFPNGSAQILFVSYDDYDAYGEKRNIRFDCAREIVKYEKYSYDCEYKDGFVEHPEARMVYDALVQKNNEFANENLMVVRVSGSSLFGKKGHKLIKEDKYVNDGQYHCVNIFHKAMVETRYCWNLDKVPMYWDREFNINIDDVKCYVLYRGTECESGE